eukprot:7776752-Karenia_brevis.AAC.1
MEFFTGDAMLPVFMQEVYAVQNTVRGHQYCCDHTTFMVQMNVKVAQAVRGQLILDRDNFYKSACGRQAPRVEELFNNGCEIK